MCLLSWGAMYQNSSRTDKSDHKRTTFRRIKDLARQKLAPNQKIEPAAKIAWVSILVMLKFDLSEQYSKTMSSELVESFMRIVFCIPKHRQFMHTGTPSEPILAEAAAHLIEKHNVNMLDVLEDAFDGGLIAKGDRGEILARHLFISAQHRAARKAKVTNSGFFYHRPLPLLDFLQALLTPEAYNTVCKATPVDDSEDTTPLEVAFKDAYVNFSHFALAGDFTVMEINTLAKFFARGTALQCADNQRLLDSAFPMAFASSVTSPLNPGDFSVFQNQIKNRLERARCDIDTSVTFPKGQVPQRPVLSFVFELGLDSSLASTVHMPKISKRGTRSNSISLQSRHYQITMLGLEGLKFDLDEDRKRMKTLLMPGRIYRDFPREDNWDLVMQSNPVWAKGSRIDWV